MMIKVWDELQICGGFTDSINTEYTNVLKKHFSGCYKGFSYREVHRH